MALRYAPSVDCMAAAACASFRRRQLEFGAEKLMTEASCKLTRKKLRQYKLAVAAAAAAAACTTREEQLSAGTGGMLTDWWSSISSPSRPPASCSGQWVKPLEIESLIRSLQQQENAASEFSSKAAVPLSPRTVDLSPGYFATPEFSMLSTRLPANLPQPLSINSMKSLTTRSPNYYRSSSATVLRVAHPGAAGAHSQAASAKAYPHCHSLPCGRFEVPFHAVELGLADRAVLPIENSVGGSIHKNYDLILRHGLHIVGEVQLAVSHCLLAMPGTSKEDLKRVVSHPQALSQCERNLSSLGVQLEAVNDTAAAAKLVAANSLADTGAISSSHAAHLYGLDILESDFQDHFGNTTRFLMMAREPLLPGSSDRRFKTSVVFALENDTQDLFRALSAFALRDINLTKIESRPQRRKPLHVVVDLAAGSIASNNPTSKCFVCLFFIDFEASMAERGAQNALKELEEFASFVRVLGCYPIED